jgi:hypothetical protein
MARVDGILDRMTARSAERLTLRVGCRPTVHMDGQDVPAATAALGEADWVSLVTEVAPTAERERIRRRDPCDFVYEGFDVHVTFDLGEPCCEFRAQKVHAEEARPGDGPEIELGDVPPPRPAPAPQVMLRPLPPPPRPAFVAPAPQASSLGATFARISPRKLGTLAGGVIVVLLGLWLWLRPTRLPDLVVADAEGHPLHLADLFQHHERLVLVFVVPGDQTSPFAMKTVKEQYAAKSGFLGFAGLYWGKQAEAEHYRTEADIPFPVYGLRDTPDPFAVQDFIHKAGVNSIVFKGVYGGTTVLVDEQRRVIFHLENDGLRELKDKLAAVTE